MSNDILSPVAIETRILEISNRIAKSASVCNDTYRAVLQTDHTYELAFAKAFMAYDGPAHSKKYAAEIATEQERIARDIADAAYRYADRLGKALESELRAYQSIGASVRATYQVAGRGEQ